MASVSIPWNLKTPITEDKIVIAAQGKFQVPGVMPRLSQFEHSNCLSIASFLSFVPIIQLRLSLSVLALLLLLTAG